MAEEPTPTDLHRRFDEIVAASGLDLLAPDDATEPPFDVCCYEGSWSAPGSDAPLLARLSGMAQALADTPAGVEIRERVTVLLGDDCPALPADKLPKGLKPVQWYLDQATERGLRLTAAGHLNPSDVVAAGAVVPRHRIPFGQSGNRESSSPELRRFRDALVGVGLLREEGRRILTTPTGADVRTDPFELFMHLSSALVPQDSPFGRDAALLILLDVATSGGTPWLGGLRRGLGRLADVLTQIGWRVGRDSIYDGDLVDLPLVSILDNTGPASAALAREALLSWNLEH